LNLFSRGLKTIRHDQQDLTDIIKKTKHSYTRAEGRLFFITFFPDFSGKESDEKRNPKNSVNPV
jgi:hypothetical protein